MMTTVADSEVRADLRALRARHQVPLYWVARKIGLHPSRVGQMLNGKIPMPDDVASRIKGAIEQEAAGR